MVKKARVSPWDLTALLNAADPKASLPERHLWLIRLLEWLRHAPVEAPARSSGLPVEGEAQATPTPVLRLKHLLGVLDRHPEHHARVSGVLRRIWSEVDNAALLADFGFAPRMDLWGELGRRVRARILPLTPATTDLGELFALLFPQATDADWLLAIDDATLQRLRTYVAPERSDSVWRTPFLEAIVFLASAVRASGFSPSLRLRMSPSCSPKNRSASSRVWPSRSANTPTRLTKATQATGPRRRAKPRCCRKRSTCAHCSTPAGAAPTACTSTSKRTACRSTWCSRWISCASVATASTRC